MSEREMGILGAGGQADEVESYDRSGRIRFRAVDPVYISEGSDLEDINKPRQEYADMPVLAAIGAPALKREMIERWAGEDFESVISDEAYVDPSADIGRGSIIAPRVIITTKVRVGEHVLVNIAATISHDVEVGDYSTISPGVHIGGRVKIGRGAFIGIGATISNDVHLADGVVVGAGAVVVESVDVENAVVVGVPAQAVKVREGWLREI